MQTKMFALYDGKAKAFSIPFFKLTLGEALRDFDDACNDPQCKVNRHPGDYTLYEVGTYDDTHAEIVPLSPLNLVATAIEYKRTPKTLDEPKIELKEK